MSVEAMAWALKQVTSSAVDKLVLVALGNFADDQHQCFPSRKTIAAMAMCSVDTLDRALVRLHDAGLIAKATRTSTRGGLTSNCYTLLVVPIADAPTSKTTPSRKMRPPTLAAECPQPSPQDAATLAAQLCPHPSRNGAATYEPLLEPSLEQDTPLPPDGGRTPSNVEAKPSLHLEALRAFEAYNARALTLGLPQASKLTPDRSRRIQARLRDFGTDGWTKALANLDTPFLRGLTGQRFRADLDFVCQPKSFARLHDGGYAPAPTPAPGVTHETDRSRTARYPTKHERLQSVVARCLERNAGPTARPDWARDLDGDALTIVPSA